MIRRTKVKNEHHILKEFHPFLQAVEQHPSIQRIIPGRIDRKQKKSSVMRFRVSYFTETGLKCIMSKGSTAQELFVICNPMDTDMLGNYLQEEWEKY